MSRQLLVAALLGLAGAAGGERPNNPKALYEGHDYFRLREALRSEKDAPQRYRAAVAAAFHDDATAERLLKGIAGPSNGSSEGVEAARILHWVRRRTAADLNQVVGSARPSRIRYSMKQGLLHIPLTINGQAVEYIFDTGAGCSVMLESEAKRLGLKFYPAEAQAFDAMSGGSIRIQNIGIAERMRIGENEYRRILFLIFPDGTHFLKDQPPGESGVFGLPDIVSLGAVRWDGGGNMEIGFDSAGPATVDANMAFDLERLIASVELEKRGLIFQVDTGAVHSGLYTRFRNEFAGVAAKSARQERRSSAGAGGRIEYDVLVLPSIGLRAGGFNVLLQPAEITLKQELGFGYHGILGMDVLKQARSASLDFRRMRMELR